MTAYMSSPITHPSYHFYPNYTSGTAFPIKKLCRHNKKKIRNWLILSNSFGSPRKSFLKIDQFLLTKESGQLPKIFSRLFAKIEVEV